MPSSASRSAPLYVMFLRQSRHACDSIDAPAPAIRRFFLPDHAKAQPST